MYCLKAKDLLVENNIEFEELDTGKDAAASKEMFELTGRHAVPVIRFEDNSYIIGFYKDAIIKKLNI